MATYVDVNIVSSSLEAASDSGSEGGPAKLMKGDHRTDLEADDYPKVTAHVNLEPESGTVGEVENRHFTVTEGGDDAREILSLEFMNDAVDLAFVFDDTGSMGGEIEGAKAGVTDLTTAIDEKDVDARYALVTFKDSDVEVDQGFTRRASRLKSKVDDLSASAGGPRPEANFDAIERALDLNWRSDSQCVIVDITDAPSHYRGDGYGTTEYTFDQVARDIRKEQVSFISVAPDRDNRTDSIKTLTGEVGGLWTDISELRSGILSTADTGGFEDVLDRISSLLASTYVLTYASCAPPGERTEVRIDFDHPTFDGGYDTAWLSVPSRYELPPECRERTTTTGSGTTGTTTGSDTTEAAPVERVDDEADTPGVTRVDDPDDDAPKVTREEVVDLAVLPDETAVDAGGEVAFEVRSEKGSRVEGATVTAAGHTATTGSRGRASVRFDETGEYTVEVAKPDGEEDYGSDSVTITVR